MQDVPGDEEDFEKWGGGVLPDGMMALLHRVLFYGDHVENVKDLAHLLGLRVLMEGRDMAEPGVVQI
ncbi:MAG: hypothetical protein HUU20_03610 [Pirellulales bacterium]|nr:hypothetical protein [Pirellulales bacterium]